MKEKITEIVLYGKKSSKHWNSTILYAVMHMSHREAVLSVHHQVLL